MAGLPRTLSYWSSAVLAKATTPPRAPVPASSLEHGASRHGRQALGLVAGFVAARVPAVVRRSYSIVCACVITTVRLAGLQFATGKGGPAGRVTKSMAKETEAMGKLFYISRDTHHNIEACCDAEGA